MEKRLEPINGLLGLVRPDGLYPSPLKDAGFELVGLEIPVRTHLGNVEVDVLLHHPGTNLLVPCESKSGANVKDEQAKRYGAVDAPSLVQAAQVTMRQRSRPTVQVLYVCLEEHLDRTRLGLSQASRDFAILTIGPSTTELHHVVEPPPPLRNIAWPVSLSVPPPLIIGFDHLSDDSAIRPAVHAELVAGLAHRREQVTIPYLTERAAPNYALYGRATKRRLVKRVENVARAIAADDPETFAYVPSPPNGDAVVRLLKTPETNDPRGRTQAYQALTRTASRRRQPSKPRDPDQLDLLQVIGASDDEESDAEQPGGEVDA